MDEDMTGADGGQLAVTIGRMDATLQGVASDVRGLKDDLGAVRTAQQETTTKVAVLSEVVARHETVIQAQQDQRRWTVWVPGVGAAVGIIGTGVAVVLAVAR